MQTIASITRLGFGSRPPKVSDNGSNGSSGGQRPRCRS
jgi:hypothetical protein